MKPGLDADVLIIGAGAAGLAAAADLEQAGLNVCIIEARDRIGGRVLTLNRNDFDYPIELGAEFVHGKAPSVFNVADSAGLVLADITDNHRFQRNGRIVESGEYWKDVETILGHMAEMPHDMSFSDYLDKEFPLGAQASSPAFPPGAQASPPAFPPGAQASSPAFPPGAQASSPAFPPGAQASPPATASNWETAREVVLSYVQGFNAASADRIGIKGLAVQEEAEEKLGETQFRVVSGYQSLLNAIAVKFKNTRILLRTIVKKIEWNNETVTATVIDEVENRVHELHAGKALITIPASILKAERNAEAFVEFVPPLDDKQKALQFIEMGPVSRTTFRFSERFWESIKLPGNAGEESLMDFGFMHNSDLPVPTWWTQLPVRVPLLVAWTAGANFESRFQNSQPEEITSEALNSLSKLLNVSRAKVEEMLVESYTHNWQADPFSLGAYCYVRPNGVEQQKQLAKPLKDTLFFAGEATNTEGNGGTVHGALDTGHRAAQEILKVLHAQ